MTLPSKRRLQITRNTMLFIVGLLGLAHETLINDADRPTLLLIFAACLGLPAFLGESKEQK